MPFQNLDVAAFIDEPPEFEYRDGLFFVRQRFSETCVIERVMRPHVFFRSFNAAARVMQDYHAHTGAEIIPVDFDNKFERVYTKGKSA